MRDLWVRMSNQLPEPNQSEFGPGGDQQDEIANVLSHSYRRFILKYLQNDDTPQPIGEVATELVAWKNPLSAADQLGDGRATLVEISLVHSHLPKMAEAGLIRYDEIQQTVTLGDRADEGRAHLQTMVND